MDKAEKLAYDRHIDAVMIQNDVLSTAKLEGHEEGHQLGLEEGRQRGLEEGIEKGIEKGIEQGIEQGIERGIEKGIEKEKTITARKLKSLNISVDTIMQVTGFSAEEIEKL